MTGSKLYWVGFEDGLVNAVCNGSGLTASEAFTYRKGFSAGVKAADEMAAAGL